MCQVFETNLHLSLARKGWAKLPSLQNFMIQVLLDQEIPNIKYNAILYVINFYGKSQLICIIIFKIVALSIWRTGTSNFDY